MKDENLRILKENGINVPSFEVINWIDKDKKIDISSLQGKYAIRSSCNLEDGDISSFAGLFETYLNVSPKDINKRVKDCFNSLNNKKIDSYLKKNNIDRSSLKMNVIIEEMVDSKLSGVIFTSNPNGLINEVVITVGKGIGSVVSDEKSSTSYYYNTTDNIYYYEGKKDLLDKELIDKLIIIQNKIKSIFGECLDIEFAIDKDRNIYILQTRKITTLNNEKVLILDNSNIVESYPGVSLPLTISFVKFVYSGVFKKAAFRIVKNKKVINNYSDSFNNMVGSSSARIYYKISNWYTFIKFLPFSKKIIPIWQDMLGVKNKSYNNEKVKIPFFTRIKVYFNSIYELIKAPKNMDILNNKFITINEDFHKEFNNNMSTIEVINLYNKVKEEVLDSWDITLVNDMYSFLFTGLLKKRLKKKNYDSDTVNKYISGISNIESLKPIESLITIAYKKDQWGKDIYEREINNYIYKYGDRALEELKLESETFRSNPKLLEDKIKEYRRDLKKLKELYESITYKEKEEIDEDFITRFISKRAMLGIKNREISRLNRSRIYGMVRSMFLQIGNNLVKEKRLKTVRDIFYLTIDEIFNYKDYDLIKIVKDRKNDYVIYNELPNYSRLIFAHTEFDKHHKMVNNVKKSITKDKLLGTPSSNGIVTGEALVIDNINQKLDVKDKILVTKMTDPGWVFLLATCKGVISEKGSLLSHTAIISRELKVPSIVGVDDATNIIKTGDKIKMDANTGEIEIIERGK